ncbi:MAG: adenylyltransferase/cytidyltransferase family protein [Lachnospiraceae bacterium]|nr:adenylyltransferase/cytidyltransferase family protein [Lachnospiraceae bacterium]
MSITNEHELLTNMREAIYSWYPFPEDASVFYVNEEKDLEKAGGKYDYVISIAAPEKTDQPVLMLERMKAFLKPDGHMLLGMNNRMGIKYFCGDRDPYTDRSFDGVEGYWRTYAKPEDEFVGRAYDEAEIRELLLSAGWKTAEIRMWSVLSGLDDPFLIFASDYLPNEELSIRVSPEYNYPKTVFLEEAKLYSQLIKNGLFYKMGNAYLIECGPAGSLSDMVHVTSSLDRGPERALYTVIHRNGTVEKKAAFPEGRKQLRSIAENLERLGARGISVVSTSLSNDGSVLRMPFDDAPVGTTYMRQLAAAGEKDELIAVFDRFWDTILASSEHVEPDAEYLSSWKEWFLAEGRNYKEKDWDNEFCKAMTDGPVLREAYIDMVPLNCFYDNGEFSFFDQEFRVKDMPAKEVMWRAIGCAYGSGTEFQKLIPIEEMRGRYGLKENMNTWSALETEFIGKLRNAPTMEGYRSRHWADYEAVNTNRQRMNFSADEYKRLFVDIFDKCDTRKVIIFGSGNYAKMFLSAYGNDYDIVRILDNRKDKWGQTIDGIPIMPPDSIKDFSSGEYKVIICIKSYPAVVRQLREMGIYEISIFNPAESYSRRVQRKEENVRPAGKKKYHIGYIAGVFDLFHIGHLNMFRRAKEQCDYLIVGVVTDEGVRMFKHVEPFIPFEERIEMVRSCRYVDEAVNIPVLMGGTDTAWRMLHFDVQFSGSDYENDPYWLKAKQFLEEHGADLVFFPYTQQTSSTKIKALINHRLEDDQNSH